ncbi:MAG: hypothetical protein ACI8QC_003336 [Planctomycetota bacterium]|jgi:hypothetical protein
MLRLMVVAPRWPHVALGVYLLVALLALAWPGPDLIAGRIRPFVLGLPFAMAWNTGWVVLTFLTLALYHSKVGAQD